MSHTQFQVRKSQFTQGRLVEIPASERRLSEGEILVKIDHFAYTANNITYAAAGERIGYWQFFPPFGEDVADWGVIPVWGYGDVIESNVADIPVGDRLFGYFPPASFLRMQPVRITQQGLVDGSAHRGHLPAGYNLYRRVLQEPDYQPELERERMLLMPGHITAYCLKDALQEKDWFGAEQVLILSASSKTGTGLGYAIKMEAQAPTVIGFTSAHNLATVNQINLYDQTFSYDQIDDLDSSKPTVIVDMSGNRKVLARLHQRLGDQMKFTSNVGLTHWDQNQPQEGFIRERSKMFFAPSHIQKRLEEWGPVEFNRKSGAFMKHAALKTKEWLRFKSINGLEGLAAIHQYVCKGKIAADQGLIVNL